MQFFRYFRLVPCFLSLSACSSHGRDDTERAEQAASGAAVLNANEIFGSVGFTNPAGAVQTILVAQGIVAGGVAARTVAPPFIEATTGFDTTTPVLATYTVTVTSPPPGFSYTAQSSVGMNVQDGFYGFATPTVATFPDSGAASSPLPVLVPPDPPADPATAARDRVQIDFLECAGVLDVRFLSGGLPFSVNDANASAVNSSSPEQQARRFFSGGDQLYLPVRGDGNSYRADILYSTGADPFHDKIRRLCQATTKWVGGVEQPLTVGCDEIAEIHCDIQGGGTGPGVDELGRIIGQIDMLREDELRLFQNTLVQAVEGPFANERFDTVLNTPSQGAFELENLLFSDAEVPVTGLPHWYRVYGTMGFRLGRRYESFVTPELWDGDFQPPIFDCMPPTNGTPNSRVCVPGGQTVDLMDTFVMDPGYVKGQITLKGPEDSDCACLENIYRDPDGELDGDGIPNDWDPNIPSSNIHAHGLNRVAPGATKTALGAFASTVFEGEYDPAQFAFKGDYELALGGLLQESSFWQVGGPADHQIMLRMLDPQALARYRLGALTTDPKTYEDSHFWLNDYLAPEHVIVPTNTLTQDIDRCFSKVTLEYSAVSGTFQNPRVLQSSGSFNGTDYHGNAAHYDVTIEFAQGTPTDIDPPASSGSVNMCLPQGNYHLRPYVTSIDSGGGTSQTQLPDVDTGPIGCGQCVTIRPPVSCTLNVSCADASGTAQINGQCDTTDPIQSPNPPITSIDWNLNSSATSTPVQCTDGLCNQAPEPYTAAVPGLHACKNTISVTATHPAGQSAIQAPAIFDLEPPVLHGCANVTVPSSTPQGASVTLPVTATDNCSMTQPFTCFETSSHAPVLAAHVFPNGTTNVTCTSGDGCNNAQCAFDVTVGVCSEAPTVTTAPVAPVPVCGTATDQARVTIPAPSTCDRCLTSPPTTLVEANFNATTNGFTYADNRFRGTTGNGVYENGTRNATGGPDSSGALQVRLGDVNNNNVTNMSGGFRLDLPPVSGNVSVTFKYKLTQTAQFEADEFSQILFELDNVLKGVGTNDYVARIQGTHAAVQDNPGPDNTTGWQTVTLDLGPLTGAGHFIEIGGFTNKKTSAVEVATMLFDDLVVTSSSCPSAALSGAITQRNGVAIPPLPIPASGVVNLSAGMYTVVWTATGTTGATGQATQTVTVVHQDLANDATCCPVGTNVIVGTNGPNNLNGGPGRDCILGLGGNDTINGNGGNDLISGGAGTDAINGGPGNDILFGGPGNDFINGGPQADTCAGNGGADVLISCP